MLPAERGEMCERRVGDEIAALAERVQRAAEVDGVPQRNRRRDQGKPAGTILLRLGRAVAQAAETVEADRAGERVA